MNFFKSSLQYQRLLFQTASRSRRFLSSAGGSAEETTRSYTWLLVFPLASFGLGTWQVRRLEWKKELIKDLEKRTKTAPVPYVTRDMLIPGRVEQMEYNPVVVEGRFDHSKEIMLGPRVRNDHSKPDPTGLIAHGKSEVGYHVVTPLILDDGERILVNRGWVSSKNKNSNTRPEGQITDKVRVSGLVRKRENAPKFNPKVKEDSLDWHYCDIYGFSQVLNTLPLLIDADSKSGVPGGPVGGQTRVTLRNEHLSYIITWYTLSAATLVLWYQLRKKPGAMFKGPKVVE